MKKHNPSSWRRRSIIAGRAQAFQWRLLRLWRAILARQIRDNDALAAAAWDRLFNAGSLDDREEAERDLDDALTRDRHLRGELAASGGSVEP